MGETFVQKRPQLGPRKVGGFFGDGFLSAALRQSEICVKSSVFHTVFDVKFHDIFGREKRRKISLPHFCREAALRFLSLD